jgi:anti-anti-sigma factor
MDTVNGAMRPEVADFYVEVGEPGAGQVMTLRLIGTLNVYSAPTFAARVEDAMKHGAWSLVVNLAGVSHADAEVGVGALLRALRRLQAGNGTLLLAEVPEQVRKAIRARGLGLVLHSFPTEESAVTFLATWNSAA